MANGEGFDIPAGTIVMETAVSMEGLKRDLERGVTPMARRAGERAEAAFSEGFNKSGSGRALEGAKKGLKDLGDQAKKSKKKVLGAGEGVDQLRESGETATKSLAGLAAILATKLSRGAAHATAKLGGLLEFGVMALGQGAQNAGQQLQAASKDMEIFGGVANQTGEAIEGTGKAAEETAKQIKALKVALITGITGTIIGSVAAANKFEGSFNKIQTVIGGTEESLDGLRSELSELAAETGQTAETVNETFFKAITRMPRLAEDTEKAIKLVRTALEAGATGFTDPIQAIETYEAVLQGFNLEAANAEEVSDKLFHTQQRAGVEFDRIAQSIGDVASLSDALGGEFEELLSIYAALVPTGQSVSEVTTQVRAVIQSMIDPTAEARKEAERLGVELSAAAIRSKGLIGAVEDIIETTEGDPEIIARLFGRQEAQTLLLTLADRLPKVRKELNLLGEAQGEHAETFETMNEELGRQKDLIVGEWSDALRQLGFEIRRKFNEPLLSTLELIRKVSEEFTNFFRAGLEATTMQGIMLVPDPTRFREALRELRGGGIERTMEDVFGPRGEGLSFDTSRRPDPEPIDRPEAPVEAHVAMIEAQRARREVEAFRDFLETGNEEAYQRRLEGIQREVNQLVAESVRLLQQHGAEAQELQKLISLYDTQIDQVDILSDEFAGLEESLRAVGERMGALEGDGAPLPPGMESEDDLVGFAESDFASKVAVLDRRLEELEAAGADAGEIFSEMQSLMDDLGVDMEDLQKSSEGLARVVVRKLGKVLPIWTGWAEGTEDASDETKELKEDLQEISTVANGILNVADALGILGDDARKALRGVSDLLGALQQTAKEGEDGFLGTGLTTGGFLGAVGAGASIISGLVGFATSLFGESREEKQLRQDLQDLRRSVDRLKSSIDAQRQALESVPGGLLSRIQEGLRGEGDLGDTGGFPLTAITEVLREAGLSTTDILQLGQDMPNADQFQFLFDVLAGRRSVGDDTERRRLEAQWEAFVESVLQLDASDAFQNFEGQLQRLQTRLELFNVDDPAEKLERFLDLLLEFADLPTDVAETLEGADLETAEGRQAVLSTLQGLFERIAGGEEGLLGDLTLPQFRDLISRMQGLIEEGGGTERGGRSEEFTRTRSITEVTGMRMVGILTTMDFRLQQLVAIGRQMVGGSSLSTVGIEPVPGAPEMVPARAGRGTSIDIGGVSATVGEINVMSGDSPGETATAVREDLADQVSREIADRLIDRLRAAGVGNANRFLRGEG